MTKIHLLLFLLFSNYCCADIYSENGHGFYSGYLTHEKNAQLLKLYQANPFSKLVISSRGGSVKAGIELGQFIFANKLDVRVKDKCYSSCTNYILPAANNLELESSSHIAWHGGAFQLKEIPSKNLLYFERLNKVNTKAELDTFIDDFHRYMLVYDRELLHSEFEFLKKLGFRPSLLIFGQSIYSYKSSSSPSELWTFSDDILQELFEGYKPTSKVVTLDAKIRGSKLHYFTDNTLVDNQVKFPAPSRPLYSYDR